MPGAHARPLYTGYAPPPRGRIGQDFCGGCGHPHASCCCACPECRKEAKDLLVQPSTTKGDNPGLAAMAERLAAIRSFGAQSGAQATDAAAPIVPLPKDLAIGTAFVGGGCCVHFSVEYTPTGTADGLVLVGAADNDTEVMWIKNVSAGLGYQVKQGVVTSKPGATLSVVVSGATARVRWCEVFSCC